jgi:outer membrane protein assembly factor BamD
LRRRAARTTLALLLLALLGPAPAPAARQDAKLEELSDQELLDLGTQRLERGKYYKARQIFERLLRRPNVDPRVVPDAHLGLADAYFGKHGVLNVTEAMSRYSNFLTFYPTDPRADYAQYRLALCHFQQVYAPDRDQNETRTAIEEFRRVQALYPDSPYVDLAAEKIQEASDVLADHEYRVGKFYFDRKAYLGAIDRFLTILDLYPRYPDKDRLYYYLGNSLLRVERNEEGEIYLLKLLETYPRSEYAKKARAVLPEGVEP